MKRSRFMGIFTPLQIRSLIDQFYFTNTNYVENPTIFKESIHIQKRTKSQLIVLKYIKIIAKMRLA